MSVRWILCILLALIAATQALPALAEEKTEEEEAAAWAKEEEAEKKLMEGIEGEKGSTVSMLGAVSLTLKQFSEEQKANPTKHNVGSFVTAEGKQFVLRVDNEYLLKWLAENAKDRKIVMHGKLRVEGRYFVASNADFLESAGTSAPPVRRKRGGM